MNKLETFVLNRLQNETIEKIVAYVRAKIDAYEKLAVDRKLKAIEPFPKIDDTLSVNEKKRAERLLRIANVVCKNQLKAPIDNLNQTWSLALAAEYARALETVSHFVSIQPMEHRLASLYSLRYKHDDTDQSDGYSPFGTDWPGYQGPKMVLEIVSQPIQAEYVSIPFFASEFRQGKEKIVETIVSTISKEALRLIKENSLTVPHYPSNSLLITILNAANEIARQTRRGCGNVAIMTEKMWERMRTEIEQEGNVEDKIDVSLRSWKFNRSADREYLKVYDLPAVGGVRKVGLIDSNLTILVSEHLQGGDLFVGYVGVNGETDAGLFFSPYIPISKITANETTGGYILTNHAFTIHGDNGAGISTKDYYAKIDFHPVKEEIDLNAFIDSEAQPKPKKKRAKRTPKAPPQ